MLRVWFIFRLVRADSSLLVFLSVFVPLLARGEELATTFRRAIPLLFIGMCAFLVNDLDDLESDKTNHPDRPLPSGQLTPVGATGLYFLLLGVALFTTRAYVPTNVAYWHYVLLTLVISYGYVVDYLPPWKPFYVSAASTVPVLIVIRYFPGQNGLYLVAVATYAFVLARELCMDFVDREGDRPSFIQGLSADSIGLAALAAHTLGVACLAGLLARPQDVLVLSTLAGLSFLAIYLWFRTRTTTAVRLMKGQLFIGLYFLWQ